MADAWTITFANGALSGNTLLSASEGAYEFKPGLKRRKLALRDMPLGCGQVGKDGGYSGATHQLKLIMFTSDKVADNVWSETYARLQLAWNGTEGTLTIPGLPAFARCLVVDVDCAIQETIAYSRGTTLGAETLTDAYKPEFIITFQQL